MTWFAIAMSVTITLLIAAIMFLLPTLSRPTIPLGVSVPQARAGDPSIRWAVRRFRTWVCAAFVVSVIVAFLLALVGPVFATLIPMLLMVALAMTAYVEARRHIQRAKREGEWYKNVEVRLSGSVTPAAAVRAPIPVGWYIAALAVLVAVVAIGVARYDSLPASIPTHWNGAGVADAYSPKSVGSVFGALLGGVGTVVLLYLIGLAVRYTPTRAVPQDTPQQAVARGAGMQHFSQDLLGQLTLLIGVLFAAISLFGWLFPKAGWFPPTITGVFVAAIAVLVFVYAIRFRRMAQPKAVTVAAPGPVEAAAESNTTTTMITISSATHHPRFDAPDDDHHWKAGIFYYNRDDPALMVPKRFGIGWTINIGHPAGMVILGLTIVVIAAAITTSVLTGRHFGHVGHIG